MLTVSKAIQMLASPSSHPKMDLFSIVLKTLLKMFGILLIFSLTIFSKLQIWENNSIRVWFGLVFNYDSGRLAPQQLENLKLRNVLEPRSLVLLPGVCHQVSFISVSTQSCGPVAWVQFVTACCIHRDSFLQPAMYLGVLPLRMQLYINQTLRRWEFHLYQAGLRLPDHDSPSDMQWNRVLQWLH